MILYLILFLSIILIFLQFRPNQNRHPKLPPTVPWALPLLGHLLSFGDFPCRTLLEWKKKYGPIFFVQFGSFRTLVFNDAKILKEAYKVNALCDRMPLKQFKDAAQNKGFMLLEYHGGEQQRFLIKNLKLFSNEGSALESSSNKEISKLLDVIAECKGKPYPIRSAFVHTTVNPIWAVVMGYTFPTDDPELLNLNRFIHKIVEVPNVVRSLGIFVPWLSKLLPGLTGVNSWVAAYHGLVEFMERKIEERKFTRVKNQPRNATDAYLDKTEGTTDPSSTFFPSKNFLPHTMAELFIGAGDTVSTTLEWTILLLAKHQKVQQKLQEEISQVITSSRHPLVSDRKNMPYTEAIINEVFRFSSFLPMSLAHFTNEDVEFDDIFIPKNTMLLQNTFGIHYDPDVWDHPEEFIPERFLDKDGNFEINPNMVLFGPGKRRCIGRDIARDQLFIFVTRIFQRFTIEFGDVVPDIKHRSFSSLLRPDPFSATFTERN